LFHHANVYWQYLILLKINEKIAKYTRILHIFS
jgi:hypothetical protein